MTDDQAERIIALLTEIRSLLPAAEPPVEREDSAGPVIMFGYVLGSGEYPTESQVRQAEDLLSRAAESNRPHPAAAIRAAQEIVHAGRRR